MMFNVGIFFVFLSLLSMISTATAKTVVKPSFRISYAGSQAGRVYAQFVQSIYEELGFNVSIMTTPSKRGLMLLNDYKVDADVIRLKSVATKYDNVILVEPAFAYGYLVLLCQKNVPCNLSALHSITSRLKMYLVIMLSIKNMLTYCR